MNVNFSVIIVRYRFVFVTIMATNNKDIYYKEITLNSADRRTGTLDRPLFYFDTFMDEMDSFSISRVILPTTYYVFTSPNYISMTLNGTSVTWDAGNYTPSEWIAVVAAQVPAVTITYSQVTGLLKMTGATVNASFNAATEFAWQLLGFASAAGTNGGFTSFTLPNVAQFSGPNFCYLRSKIASVFNGSNLYFSKALGDSSQEDKLLMIPIDQNRNSVVNYITVADRYFDWADSQTRTLEFYFTLGDRSTEVMSFNGVPFQLVVTGFSSQFYTTEKVSQNINLVQHRTY